MKIYIVIASSGEYSNREEWPERAYTSEQLAKDFVEKMTRLDKAVIAESRRTYDWTKTEIGKEYLDEYPKATWNHRPIVDEYFIKETELIGVKDEAQS